jgi:hypothetical protein
MSSLVAVAVVLRLLRVKLDDRINAHDGYASLHGTLQLLDLAHAGLQHTSLESIVNPALGQIQTVVAVSLLLGDGLLLLVGIAVLHTL